MARGFFNTRKKWQKSILQSFNYTVKKSFLNRMAYNCTQKVYFTWVDTSFDSKNYWWSLHEKWCTTQKVPINRRNCIFYSGQVLRNLTPKNQRLSSAVRRQFQFWWYENGWVVNSMQNPFFTHQENFYFMVLRSFRFVKGFIQKSGKLW